MTATANLTEPEKVAARPYQTIEEIEAEYPDHWIWVDRPTMDALGRLTGGFVAFASHDRDERNDWLGRHVDEFTRLASHITKKLTPGAESFMVSVWNVGGGDE